LRIIQYTTIILLFIFFRKQKERLFVIDHSLIKSTVFEQLNKYFDETQFLTDKNWYKIINNLHFGRRYVWIKKIYDFSSQSTIIFLISIIANLYFSICFFTFRISIPGLLFSLTISYLLNKPYKIIKQLESFTNNLIISNQPNRRTKSFKHIAANDPAAIRNLISSQLLSIKQKKEDLTKIENEYNNFWKIQKLILKNFVMQF